MFEDEEMDCTNAFIKKAVEGACEYVQEHCDPESTFDFYSFHYCTINEQLGIMLPMGILLIILCFYILGSTADGYLSPALETIALKLGISESLAGVTFLAFGNGAPDVISALSASGGEAGGIYLAIGALLGAGLFVSCIVAAVVILSAKDPIHVLPSVFLRDTGFYMLGPIILTIAAATGQLSVPFAVTLLVVYVIFVVVVVISDKLDRAKIRSQSDSTIRKQSSVEDTLKFNSEKEILLDVQNNDSETQGKINESHFLSHNDSFTNIFSNKSLHEDIKEVHFEEHKHEERNRPVKFTEQRGGIGNSFNNTKHRVYWSMVKMNRFLYKTVKSEDPWKEMNWFQKIVYILIDLPFDFLRRITIPPSNDEQWDRRFAMVFPICSVIFFFLVSGMIDFTEAPPILFYILLGVGLLASIIIYYTTKQQHAPQKMILLFAFFAFIMSIVWIWWVANILIDLLSLFGVVFNIKAAFLGITVLAWGNSVGDMMANSAVAKKGYARMAMTGCIAGPLFNLFFGLGVSLLKEAIAGNISDFTFGSTQSIIPTV